MYVLSYIPCVDFVAVEQIEYINLYSVVIFEHILLIPDLLKIVFGLWYKVIINRKRNSLEIENAGNKQLSILHTFTSSLQMNSNGYFFENA